MDALLSGIVANNKKLKEFSATLRDHNQTFAGVRAAVRTAANKAKDVHDIFFGLTYPMKIDDRSNYEIIKSAVSGVFKQGKVEDLSKGLFILFFILNTRVDFLSGYPIQRKNPDPGNKNYPRYP